MYLDNDEVEKFGLEAVPESVDDNGDEQGCTGCIFDEADAVHGLSCHNVRCLEPSVIWIKRADFNPVRTTDPATSHRAAQTATQRRASIKDHILLELAIHGGCTGEEIANRTTLRLNSITPRFAELTRAGKIKDSGTTRNKQIVWVIA